MSDPQIIATVVIAGLSYLGLVAYVLASIRADSVRRRNGAPKRRPCAKPGPSKREQERNHIRAQAVRLAEDVAAGRVAPLGPRYVREPKA